MDIEVRSASSHFIRRATPTNTTQIRGAVYANIEMEKTPFGKVRLSSETTYGALVAVVIMMLAISIFFFMRWRRDTRLESTRMPPYEKRRRRVKELSS